MNTRILFITKLHNLTVNSELNKGIQLGEGLRLTNNINQISTLFNNENFIQFIGKLEYLSLLGSCVVIREKKEKINPIPFEYKDTVALTFLENSMRHIGGMDTFFWMVKDNCIYQENGFVDVIDYNGSYPVSNGINHYRSNSLGDKTTVESFSQHEIQEVIKYFTIYKTISRSWNNRLNNYNFHAESNKIQRFIYFLSQARVQSYLPVRILMYSSSIEALLTTKNNKGIKRQLGERVSKILNHDYNELIHHAYQIRSNTVHGNKIDKKYHDFGLQQDVSQKLDELLRITFKEVLTNKNLLKLFTDVTDNDIDRFFQ
ncbi:HEPN domain-containing protein [Mesobacillus jeotgali]|uniref:HEPN domain-containing protein n=1 Tax=Mesobacillus jeotgali TaxID=129985 RepID=UPI001CFE18FE|nr:HEPN domain-containing protein [Mesobacillus jeotgali]